MKCPKCGHDDTKVLESRLSHEARAVRRRRSCLACEYRFTTYEKEENFSFSIQKKDGRVEAYDHDKLTRGIQTACQKRPITMEQIEMMISRMERKIQDAGDRTVSSQLLGEFIMEELQVLDKVAYVRFASVYKDFKDPQEFSREVSSLGTAQSPSVTHQPLS